MSLPPRGIPEDEKTLVSRQDIVATSYFSITMQQQLMSQMADMTPRKVMLQAPASQPLSRQQTQSAQQQIPITRTNTQDYQMSLKDIVATSYFSITMQQQLMSQMADIQPNQYIKQHTQGHITEHARDNTQVRVPHWNVQGQNSLAKQSALIAALQLDQFDVAMIQDSRIVAKKDGIPLIRVPNCHTYFIPASPECHGLLTIIRNNIYIYK